MDDVPNELQAQINKRMTLNLLIQGSAQHAFLTSHYVVRDELTQIDSDLLPLYDKFAAAALVNYWRGVAVLLHGRPTRFWKRVDRPHHPFAGHPFLVRHGGVLAAATKQRAVERCRAKGVSCLPVCYSFQILRLLHQLVEKESRHRPALQQLAIRATEVVWGISPDRLDAELTKQVAFGSLSPARSLSGLTLRATAIGYGGIVRQESRFTVMAKAWIWPLLSHELTKAVAELICLHGLNELDDPTYTEVLAAADRIEYEHWMLQAGPELWRRLLALLPHHPPLPELLMHIARLSPRALESLMMAVMEDADWARVLIAGLDEEGAEVADQGRP